MSDSTHPTQRLDDLVHQRVRLGVLTVLREGGRVQFGFLSEALGLTDGNLSRHVTTLAEAGLVEIEKGYEGRRPRTWLSLTKAGRQALADEIALLKDIINTVEGVDWPEAGSPRPDV